MKICGMIDGMSWESTQYYYQLMNRDMYAKMGGHTSIEAIIYSVNFDLIKASGKLLEKRLAIWLKS